MKKTILVFILATPLLMSQNLFGQKKIPASVIKELEAAELKMFDAIPKFDPEYWKTFVHKDYISINADGIMQTKDEAFSDSARKKMFEGISCKLFDRKIRLYGNVAIINGRSQYLMGEKMLAEVYHTEIWVKEGGKWLFNGWQGTNTKDSQTKPNAQ